MSTNGSSYKPVPGRIPGTLINLGGVEFVMPPLNLDQIREFENIIPELGKKDGFTANADEALPVIYAALSRNYPDLKLEELRALLDAGNLKAASLAVIMSSGYTPGKPGEPAPASQ